ncbi:MAG: pitrilysin family protein [Gemmatimonadaceae bacterium]
MLSPTRARARASRQALSRPALLARSALAGLAFVLGASSAAAQGRAGTGAAATRGATVEGITEYTLSNGMRVLLFPDPTKARVTVNVTYFVGSRHEGYGETGMAHLLEHLTFKGTPSHPNIPAEQAAHGASTANGTTWLDRTNYFMTLPAEDTTLAWALRLEADRMTNAFIAAKDLAREMTVVRNELEMGENDPARVLHERTMSAAYLWHAYGRAPIGARSDIERVPAERLRAFYHQHYRPDNAMLVIAGKFDDAQALATAEATFGRIPRRAGSPGHTWTEEPAQDGEREVTLRRVGDVQLMQAVYHIPAGAHPDFAAVDVLMHVLGNAPSGRLYRALVEPGRAASANVIALQLREPGVLIATAQVRGEGALDSARAALIRGVEATGGAEPPSAEEVERGRAALLREVELIMRSSEQVGLDLSEWAAMGDWRLFFIHRDRIRRVTPDDVRRVAAAYLKPSNRTLGTFIPTERPDRAEIAAAPEIATIAAGYRGDTTVAHGEAFDPSPANIDARTLTSALPGGFRLALLPKATRGRAVIAQVTLRLGSERALAGRGAAAWLTAEMLRRGTRTMSRQELKDSLDRLKAQVTVTGTPVATTVTVEAAREGIAPALALAGEMLRHPSFDAGELARLKEERLATLEAQRSDPLYLARTEFGRRMNPQSRGHAAYAPTTDEAIADVQAATLADVRAFHADFYGADGGDLVVAGDFDPAEVTRAAREVFGAWRSARPYERMVSVYREPRPVTVAIETPDRPNAFFVAGQNVRVNEADPDYPALALANFIMGGGSLNSRLVTRLRQKEGVSYAVQSTLQMSPRDRVGTFIGLAIYAPQNAVRLERAFREELARALAEGFTAAEVTAAKASLLQGRQQARADDKQLVPRISGHLAQGRTMAFDAVLDAQIAALTPADVVAAMRRHIDPAKLVVVKAGDFAKGQTVAEGR